MQDTAKTITNIIGDYENNDMSVEHIIGWVSQFDESDRKFILHEMAVIFKQTYFSKAKIVETIEKYLLYWTNHFRYTNTKEFLSHVKFLDLQEPKKSQKDLLSLLDTIIQESYGVTIRECGEQVKHYIYLDDVLSTGSTVFRHLKQWLEATSELNAARTNYELLQESKFTLDVCLLCTHDLGRTNIEYRLMQAFGSDVKKHIRYHFFYLIENNIKSYNPKLNHILPIENQPTNVKNYLASLDFATNNEDRAYRRPGQPVKESLFSSPTSRIRIENIFLEKGIEILSRVQDLRVKQLRPLGYTIKSHKTFGLGTLFFTYRNIPNNCPIVFWWANNNWRPLFVLKNRGEN